ncbi:MAG: DNA cytosine methyltransferase [Verrucomicrobiaceae bacterium]|nr:DNA cytosine methyltransferase [Verrucomicrobiaceae bacterium]
MSPLIQGIDLFAGAGGLSLGAQLAGVTVTHAIEENRVAANTYRINHPETQVIEADIRSIDPPAFKPKPAAVKLLFGGPPCQGFSTSNQRTRSADNPKNWLFGEFFRFARFSQPDWIVLENVKGLRQTADGHFEELILKQLETLGYESALWVLCAADFGVPQRRYRLFFVGSRTGRVPMAPSPQKKIVTVKHALADLPVLGVGAHEDVLPYPCAARSNYAKQMRGGLTECSGHLVTANNSTVTKRYPHIPQGGNWQNIPKRLMQNYSNLVNSRSRHTGIYRRLSWDEPSIVIANYRKNMLIHPEQHRGLSVREAARLQSFPDSYRFCGSIGLQQQQVSNAVPPLLAKAVFSQILNAE